MTFKEGFCYPTATLVRAGISEATLRQAVVDGVLDRYESAAVGSGFTYSGGQILSAIERGVLRIGPPREAPVGKGRSATVASRPAPSGSVARRPTPPTSVVAVRPKAKPQPSLESRYRAARNLWARAVDGELTLCDGDRAAASIKAHRNNPGLTDLVDE